MPFCPCLKLNINFCKTGTGAVECTKVLFEAHGCPRGEASQALLPGHSKFQPQDQNLVFYDMWPQGHWFHVMA